MKILLKALLLATILQACHTQNGPADITGDYIRVWPHNAGTLYDTIAIRPSSRGNAEDYSVIKYGTTKQDKSNKLHPVKPYQGKYDPSQARLQLNDPGLVYIFDHRNGTLQSGSHIYIKIKGLHLIRQ